VQSDLARAKSEGADVGTAAGKRTLPKKQEQFCGGREGKSAPTDRPRKAYEEKMRRGPPPMKLTLAKGGKETAGRGTAAAAKGKNVVATGAENELQPIKAKFAKSRLIPSTTNLGKLRPPARPSGKKAGRF